MYEVKARGAPPLLAILRGVRPVEVAGIGAALIKAGIRIIEVPLNSADAFESISVLASTFEEAVIGAGTVTTLDEINEIERLGASLVVMPHTDESLIRRALDLDLTPMPGFTTPSEAFRAYSAGARQLKLFPAYTLGVGHLKALLEVLPRSIEVWPVGGVNAENAASSLSAGASGLGVGSALYRPGDDADIVALNATRLIRAMASVLTNRRC